MDLRGKFESMPDRVLADIHRAVSNILRQRGTTEAAFRTGLQRGQQAFYITSDGQQRPVVIRRLNKKTATVHRLDERDQPIGDDFGVWPGFLVTTEPYTQATPAEKVIEDPTLDKPTTTGEGEW